MVTQLYMQLTTSFYVSTAQFIVFDQGRKYKNENPQGTIYLLTPKLGSEADSGFIFLICNRDPKCSTGVGVGLLHNI